MPCTAQLGSLSHHWLWLYTLLGCYTVWLYCICVGWVSLRGSQSTRYLRIATEAVLVLYYCVKVGTPTMQLADKVASPVYRGR